MKIESLYLHFPFCREICNYCSFYKSIPTSKNEIRKYEDYLLNAYQHHAKWLEKCEVSPSTLKTVYIGGGTPSFWGEEGIAFLGRFLKSLPFFEISQIEEFTIEVNPGTLSRRDLDLWRELGVNRFSVGVQTLDEVLLKKLGRAHSLQDTLDLLGLLKAEGVSFSLDFMLGLPFSVEEKRDILRELEIGKEFSPEHYSIYILTVNNTYVHQKKLPEESWVAAEYYEMNSFLKEQGYHRYEVSNFALPGKESRHNQAYWSFDPVMALGPSATGLIPTKSKKNPYVRYKWFPGEDLKFSKEYLGIEKIQFEKIYLLFRQGASIDIKQLREIFLIEAEYQSFLKNLEKREYISLSEEKFFLEAKGHLHLDFVMDELFSYSLTF